MNELRFIPGTGNAYACDKQGNIYSYRKPGSKIGELEPFPHLHCCWPDSQNRYMMTCLSFERKHHHCLVHRLIALTWIENPDNLPEVDHIDCNTKNNCVTNLRWITRKGNVERVKVDRGALNGLRSNTKLYKDDGTLIAEFSSLREAAVYASSVCGCSKTSIEKYHRSRGYYLILDNEERRMRQSKRQSSTYDLFTPTGEFIANFTSKREAGRYIKENIRDISVKLFSDKGKAYGYYVVEKSVETKMDEES